jgi:hypothetical protein
VIRYALTFDAACRTYRYEVRDAEDDAVAARERLRERYRPRLLRAATGIVTSEVDAIRAEGLSRLAQRDAGAFLAWLERHGADVTTAAIVAAMLPLIARYAAAVERAVFDELGGAKPIELADPFIAAYVNGLATGHAARSLGQLRALLQKAAEAGEDATEAVERRLGEWEQTRPGKIAERETVQAGEAAARNAYRRGGVRRLKWRANAKACPFCSKLNGKTWGIEQDAVGKGDEIDGDEGQPAMKVKRARKQPPIHGGCSCHVVKGV